MGSIIPKFGYHPTPGQDHSRKRHELLGRSNENLMLLTACPQHMNEQFEEKAHPSSTFGSTAFRETLESGIPFIVVALLRWFLSSTAANVPGARTAFFFKVCTRSFIVATGSSGASFIQHILTRAKMLSTSSPRTMKVEPVPG